VTGRARATERRPMPKVVAALLTLAALGVCVPARSADGPAPTGGAPTLAECAAAIEQASQGPDGDRVVVGHLSRKLRMSSETLRAQRARSGLGWGDILIANRLTRDTLSFDQLVGEFKSGKSWEQVARDHDADLPALLDDVQRSREIVVRREEDKAAPSEHLGGSSPPAGRGSGAGPGSATGPGSGAGRKGR